MLQPLMAGRVEQILVAVGADLAEAAVEQLDQVDQV
jgi:hypothetical protein